MPIHDYESWGRVQPELDSPDLLEAYSGQQVVGWHGAIERQVISLISQYESARNYPYAERLRVFLQTWREHRLTGSINVENVDVLEAATSQLAADPWRLSNYFMNLRDQLRRLKASLEELPLSNYVERPKPQKSQPPSTASGPEENPPKEPAAEQPAPATA